MTPLRSFLALALTTLYLAITVSAVAVERDARLAVRATATTTTSAVQVSQTLVNTQSSPPFSSGSKKVYAHHMVGNTYSYNVGTWNNDIHLAQLGGIDGFALNIGIDSWQLARIADAYATAKAMGTGFELFISFDVTSLGCASESDAAILRNLVTTYYTHPNQAHYNGKVLVSSFGGNYCYFGETTVSAGWMKHFRTPLAAANLTITFIPAIFVDPSTLKSTTWLDGALNWDSAWPTAGANLDASLDRTWIDGLGGKIYMPSASPSFFTYYSPQTYNKDWTYRGDNWLLATRWESLISFRERMDMVELLTWNDYGESSYLGPIRVDQPNSQAWVNRFPHTAWLSMNLYYATAFKTGSWPTIKTDQIFIWSRPHPHDATPTAPTLARPTGWQNTDDNLYALVFATADCLVTLTSGTNVRSFNVNTGVTRLFMSSAPGGASGVMARSGKTVAQYSGGPGFQYTNQPKDYNYNYFVGYSG